MQSLIYDVAVSIDGYIAGANADVSLFAHEGAVVEDYHARMADYKVAIMGRKTYEFGYQFGLKPGDNPYPSMQTIVFSNSVSLPDDSTVAKVSSDLPSEIESLKVSAKGPIYLCGGGEFAGNLLSLGLIDKIILKRAPILLGTGTRLFGKYAASQSLKCISHKQYDSGYVLQGFVP
ncbi:MAG: dihydrofolate reductase family protein [Pseudomonadota bacterium]